MNKNLCIESGCKGYCCHDTCIEVTDSERTRLFPDAIPLQTLDELKHGNLMRETAYFVRYRRSRLGRTGFKMVGWIGKCPNLTSDGNCKKHSEREYAARNFKFGSRECNSVRTEYGLPPVFVEPVE